MTSRQIYDGIGEGYANLRRADPRISAAIVRALGAAEMVINVGAGSGSYEPEDRTVVAVEPSITMIRQRINGIAPAVQALAESLPFHDDAFDAGMAVLTVHHWNDLGLGLRELLRVVRGQVVILTYDTESALFWLVEEYFPEIIDIDRDSMPLIDELRDLLGNMIVDPLPIPHDCVDGFLGAYWRRPEMYLDERVRQVISAFTKIEDVSPGLTRLQNDLADGTWSQRHGYLMDMEESDLGYRLITATN